MANTTKTINGTWYITSEGNLCSTELTNNTCPTTSTEIKVSVDGKTATEGTITFTNGKITDVQNLKTNGTVYSYNSSKVLVEGTTSIEETTDETVIYMSYVDSSSITGPTIGSSITAENLATYSTTKPLDRIII